MAVNGTMLVPTYDQADKYEQEAIQVYRDLGFDVVPVDTDWIAPLQARSTA